MKQQDRSCSAHAITLVNEGTNLPFLHHFLIFFKTKPHTLIQTYNYKLLTKVEISDTAYFSFYFWTIKEVKTDWDNAKIWKLQRIWIKDYGRDLNNLKFHMTAENYNHFSLIYSVIALSFHKVIFSDSWPLILLFRFLHTTWSFSTISVKNICLD